jgi:NosR/NirI family nitrous oxide reductase transcriptional regulator
MPENRTAGVKRLMILLFILPVLVFAGGWSWAKLHEPFSHMHRSVRLAEQVRREDLGISMKTTLESEAFRKTGTPPADLYNEASEVKRKYLYGGWITGGFLGLVFAVTLIDLSIRRKRKDYTPDRASCLSCGRCMAYCPKEHFRRSGLKSRFGNVLRR